MRRGSKNNKKHQNLREKNLWKKIYVGASTVEWPNHGLKSFIYTCSNWFLMNFGCTFFLQLIPLQRAVAFLSNFWLSLTLKLILWRYFYPIVSNIG